MNSSFEPAAIEFGARPAESPTYEPPTLTLLGNAHDLLAMAKTFNCDDPFPSAGNDPVAGNCP